MLKVQVLRASGEDVDLVVRGYVEGTTEGLIYLPAPDHKTVRFMSIAYAIEADTRVLLFWESAGGSHELLLPLEGRGALDFTKYGGLLNPREDGWTGALGLRATSLGPLPRHFTIALDLSKQRN